MRSIVILAVLSGALAFAQPPQAPPAGRGGGRGMPEPKNLKILKPDEIRAVMGSFVAGTGLSCMGCHTQGDFASDDMPTKVTARKMLAMVRGINANTFNGDQKVTCYTCHRGEALPKSAP
jgi:photosynthetic reaction center cytochrome c subunit